MLRKDPSTIGGKLSTVTSGAGTQTYAWQSTLFPEKQGSDTKKEFKIAHGDDCVEQKAKEMRESAVRNAIGGPRTVMIHFWNTSAQTEIRRLNGMA